MVVARAGLMQVNLTFLNPIEVRFRSSVTVNVHIRIILSLKIGSSSPSHSHTWLSSRTPLTAQITLSKCVLDVSGGTVSRSPEFFFSPQFGYRVCLRESIGSNSMELDVQSRCHLPQCHTPDTDIVQRVDVPSEIGYSILCHEGHA